MSESNGVANGKPKANGRKTVCLGMPSYGEITAHAALGFYRASKCERYNLNLRNHSSSLLASNFNALWCWALTEARHGRCDYFAMQHSDVEPEEWWLDKAVDELEAKGLDVLGVVAPIKGQEGVTSIATARDDGDTWRPHARLTMREVYRLPETFTSADLGRPLLINTGLWVCRMDEAWAKKVHFTVNDRICFDPEKDHYFAQVEPEDWFFSRLLHELGLKVGCTRKVELGHRGNALYGNAHPWGTWEYDEVYAKGSLLGPRDPGDWFPHDAAGWLTVAEGRELAALAEGKRVLEIGSYCGRSTICLARGAQSVCCVDPFDGRATPVPGSTHDVFLKNLGRYGVRDKVTVCVGTTADHADRWGEASFDFVFIDGDHSYESVRLDVGCARRVLEPGGVLAFHDYRKFPGEADGRWDPGVTRAVDELLADGGELLGRCDSLAIVRPPAATSLIPAGGLCDGV